MLRELVFNRGACGGGGGGAPSKLMPDPTGGPRLLTLGG